MRGYQLKKAGDELGLVENIDYGINVNNGKTWYRDEEVANKIAKLIKQ